MLLVARALRGSTRIRLRNRAAFSVTRARSARSVGCPRRRNVDSERTTQALERVRAALVPLGSTKTKLVKRAAFLAERGCFAQGVGLLWRLVVRQGRTAPRLALLRVCSAQPVSIKRSLECLHAISVILASTATPLVLHPRLGVALLAHFPAAVLLPLLARCVGRDGTAMRRGL